MRAVVQRVRSASVTVSSEVVGEIGVGLLVLLGISADDTLEDARYLAGKLCGLRVFEDDEGKMNRSLGEIGGKILVVSQFTLYGDCRKGRRPSFVAAARPEQAQTLYRQFCEMVRAEGIEVETGRFQEQMDVALINDGPVTLLLDSHKTF